MDRKKKLLPLLGYFGLLILIVVAAFLTGKQGGGETIKEVMKDAVLHEDNRIAFLGGMTVNRHSPLQGDPRKAANAAGNAGGHVR